MILVDTSPYNPLEKVTCKKMNNMEEKGIKKGIL